MLVRPAALLRRRPRRRVGWGQPPLGPAAPRRALHAPPRPARWWSAAADDAAALPTALALGLDISMRATGYCVLDAADGRLLEWGCLETPGSPDRYERAAAVAAEMAALRGRHAAEASGAAAAAAAAAAAPAPRWLIGAEDYAKRWTGGRNNLFALAEANVTTTLVCRQEFGSAPLAVHPHTARAQVGVPTAAAAAATAAAEADAADEPALSTAESPHVKERVLGFVSNCMPPDFQWPMAPRAGALHPSCYDVADAYVIARYVALHAEDCALLAGHAELLVERQDAYRASKRYATSLSKAQEKGKAAARRYEAGVTQRIERKLLADLRAAK